MKVVVNSNSDPFPLTWSEIVAKEGLYEDTDGSVIIMPRVKGSCYAVYRDGRLDFSGHTVGEPNPSRNRRKYRKYAQALTLSN